MAAETISDSGGHAVEALAGAAFAPPAFAFGAGSAARKDGSYDRKLQRRLGIRRRTQL